MAVDLESEGAVAGGAGEMKSEAAGGAAVGESRARESTVVAD